MISLVSSVFGSNGVLASATLGLFDGSGVSGGMTGGLAGSSGTLLAQAAAGGGMFGLNNILPIILMFGIFYFILIRPQQKRQRELQEWLKSIRKGDEVITTGGIYGKVSGDPDEKSPYVTLELQEKVRVKVLRSHITGKPPSNDAAGAASADAKK